MTRRGAIVVAGVALWLALGWSAAARKVVSVSATCPAGTGERMIDADGKKDACSGLAKIGCAPDQTLEVDADGDTDVCRKEDGGKGKLICPSGFSHKERFGEDACEASIPPVCRKGFKLKVRPGEDLCVY